MDSNRNNTIEMDNNKDNTEKPRSGPGIPDLPEDFDYEAYANEDVEIVTVTLMQCGKPHVIKYEVAENANGERRIVRKDSK
ncbi:hypothetical protein CEP54_010775 [Fusarium duplospermum]|uniref:Uncharacterized protein n=1 Tax=Fusarium duplospermum TaxID=1325734 RepID=A0A428PHX2_9HYPO|nr:hypothetical protein CEP54_010775 [Fusarium duplospermum]